MGRAPCCDEIGVNKGPWTSEEDKQLKDYIEKHGYGSWRHLPKLASLNRCGKSCRLRWKNYLRPDIKRGKFSEEEDNLIIHLHSVLGNKWSQMANQLPGRTDNEIKNYWNTNLRKKLINKGIDPVTHRLRTGVDLLAGIPNYLLAAVANIGSSNLMGTSWDNNSALSLQADAAYLARLQLLQVLLQVITPPNIDSRNFTPPLGVYSQFSDPISISSGYLNSNFQDVSTNLQASTESSLSNDGASLSEIGMDSNTGGSSISYINPITSNSTPALDSASPENTTTDQNAISSSSELLVHSPSLMPAFGELDGLSLDYLDTDLSWESILDKISWLDEL